MNAMLTEHPMNAMLTEHDTQLVTKISHFHMQTRVIIYIHTFDRNIPNLIIQGDKCGNILCGQSIPATTAIKLANTE